MKFLDSNGLTHFWNKIKTWTYLNYLSLNSGGSVNGDIFINGGYLSIKEQDNQSQRYIKLNYEDGINIGTHFDLTDEDEDVVSINSSYILAPQFKTTTGKSTQALIADGSVKEIGSANGIATLDSKGNVPLSQLGNLDTTVAEVVTALPTTNIKKHIYLIKDADGVTQNKYEEYIYTGDTSATYDASKWEKLGDFRATVDLKDYAKKSEAVAKISHVVDQTHITVDYTTIDNVSLGAASFFGASNTNAGLMISADKKKLDGIANNANNYSLPTASSTTKGGITLGYSQSGKNYPVVLDSTGKAYVNVPWTDTNTTYSLATSTKDGLMKASDKAKIDSIDTTYAKRMEVVGLDGIEIEKIPQDSFTVQSIVFPNVNKGDSVNITFEPATTSMDGFMSKNDKNKLNNIANGATADSAITTAEIDALFA